MGRENGMRLELLNWPVIGGNFTVLAFFQDLWNHIPGATATYAFVSMVFMLFQMSDKLGILERFKRRGRKTEQLD